MLSAGPEYDDIQPAGTASPVVHALGQLNKKAHSFSTIEDLNPILPGKDPYSWIWMYRFKNEEKFIYIIRSETDNKQINLHIYTIRKCDNSSAARTNADPIGKIPVYIGE